MCRGTGQAAAVPVRFAQVVMAHALCDRSLLLDSVAAPHHHERCTGSRRALELDPVMLHPLLAMSRAEHSRPWRWIVPPPAVPAVPASATPAASAIASTAAGGGCAEERASALRPTSRGERCSGQPRRGDGQGLGGGAGASIGAQAHCQMLDLVRAIKRAPCLLAPSPPPLSPPHPTPTQGHLT